MTSPPLSLLPYRFDPAAINAELAAQPDLWDRDPERRIAPGSPHREMTDVWVRCIDKANIEGFNGPHEARWYPAYWAVPSLRPVIFDVMRAVQAVRLGGVLITRIPPGGEIYAHKDAGWHPEYYNTKIYAVLASNDRCVNWAEDMTVCMAPGECWFFNNLVEHGLRNEGETDRVSLIIVMRVEHE